MLKLENTLCNEKKKNQLYTPVKNNTKTKLKHKAETSFGVQQRFIPNLVHAAFKVLNA